jgi:DNA-binding transcriptional regulator YdaS (Cro superfamily)
MLLMKFNDWLSKQKRGTALLAAYFKVSPAAVSQWRTKGVPIDRMLDIQSITNGEVTVQEMIESRSRGR